VSLLFDQNLSRRLPELLATEFPGSEQALLVHLDKSDDRTLWAYAAANGLAVVSKDEDFQKLSEALGPPPKFIWLRIGNSSTRAVEDLLRLRANDIRSFLADSESAILELYLS
jgi:predicted nuclease of predicted toxin-antitoxin system